jgi:hypothetical protein
MALAAFALAAAPPDEHGTSNWVNFDHRHEWVQLDSSDKASVWWDRNAQGSVKYQDREYPTVLLRVIFEPGASPFGRMESVNAVDCSSGLIATVKANADARSNFLHQEPEFRAWPDPDRQEVRALMRAVCGEARAH